MTTPILKLAIPLPRLFGPGEVLAGEGALVALRTLPAARVALVATDRAIKSSVVQRWLESANPFEIRHLLPSWAGEPTMEALSGTISALRDYSPDWIVAIGGGSVLDGAKLCWARYEHPHFPLERFDRPFALPRLRSLARFVAVPTTAGTGSENSSSAVFVESNTGRKVPVVTHDFLPDIAILDPRLTLGLPVKWTILTGLDALAHALEGRVSALVNPMVDNIAESSAADIFSALSQYITKGESLDVRSRLQIASFHAGQVQNLRLVGLAHAIAHQLGEWHVPHAAAVGILLPLTMEQSMRSEQVRTVYDIIARRCGMTHGAQMIEAIRALPEQAGIAGRLAAYCPGQSEPSTSVALDIAGRALADSLARFLPVKVDINTVATLVRRAW